MQERGINNTGLFNSNVIATSDIDKDAILGYAAIHCGLTPQMITEYKDYPSREDMVKELTEKNIGYDFLKSKPYDWSKIERKKDKTELQKYWLALHLQNNLGDISKVQRFPECDLLTFSFPCQSISIAGKQEGIVESETRSGLVYEIVRLIKVAKENNELPKYLLLENVSNLVSKKFIGDFENLNQFFDDIGYNVYWKILNAKNCGIPQNRNRVFGVYIRKDIDTGKMEFPIPFDNGMRLRDVLDDVVEDKYYLSEEVTKRFKITDPIFEKSVIGTTAPDFRTIGQRDIVFQTDGIMGSLIATDYKQPKQILVEDITEDMSNNGFVIEGNNYNQSKVVSGLNDVSRTLIGQGHSGNEVKVAVKSDNHCKQVGQIYGTEREPNPQAGRIYDADYISPTLDTCSGGNKMPKIVENNPKIMGNLYEKQGQAGNIYNPDYVSPCLPGFGAGGGGKELKILLNKSYRIRKITPIESYRLMGLTAEDAIKEKNLKISDCSLYKQAGNGIVTNCIQLIMEHLYKAQYDESFVCTDENFQ